MSKTKLLVALTFLLLILRVGVAHADSTQLDALATRLAGKPVTVQCFPPDNMYQGFTYAYPQPDGTFSFYPVIYLDGTQCGALQNVLTPGPRTARWVRSWDGVGQVGNALLTLTHEATHIALASTDEGLVECTASKNVYNAARFLPLGWKDRNAVAVAAQQAHEGYDVPEYRTVC